MAYFDGSPWWAGSDGVSDPILLHITLSYIYHYITQFTPLFTWQTYGANFDMAHLSSCHVYLYNTLLMFPGCSLATGQIKSANKIKSTVGAVCLL